MEALSPAALVSIAILLLALAVDLWVYSDARKRQQHGLAPSVSIGSVRVGTTATGRNPFAHGHR